VLELGTFEADVPVPNTIQGMLMARIDRLPEASKRLPQTAAVLGRNFRRACWRPCGMMRRRWMPYWQTSKRSTWLLVLERGAMARRLLPEVLFLHGDMDENILYQKHPVALAEILKSCGAAYTFQTYPGIDHATYDLSDRAARDTTDFFRQAFVL
jgi:acetyl esterase/lipase